KSINAHQHLTQAEIAAAYAPLASSQQSVIDYMQSYGFQVTSTSKLHLTIGFQGTVEDAENALHIQINNYRSSKGLNFYAPASDPTVPVNLAALIQGIAGLDNSVHFTRPIRRQPRSTANVATNSTSCPGPGNPTQGGAYIPSQLATAYNLNGLYNAGFRGEGQTVGLVEFDNYNASDVSNYAHCYGGSSVPIHKVLVDGGNGGKNLAPGPGAIEDELDMELVLSAAPHLAALNVYEAPNTDQGNLDMWSRIISNDTVPVVSTSWGQCETYATPAVLTEENNLFTLAAAQGETIVAAAADHGTNDCAIDLHSTDPAPFIAVDDPASQPYVTGVGGTALSVNNDNTYNSETVWNEGVTQDGSIVWAGGGGISSQWTMPAWQQGPGVNNSYSSGTPCKAASGSCREVPDVSLDASSTTPYLVNCTVAASGCSGGSWWEIGGTSAAAPMWAAFVALTNEKTLHDGSFNIGFLNPYLYQIDQNANGTSYSNDFHDITVGNNDGLNDGGNTYPATANYDMASGLGSYNALNLANDLEKLANAQNGSRGAPAATTWYFAEGAVGGSYKEYITILNPAPIPAQVNVEYFFQGQAPRTIPHTIPANVRFTITVNNDLGVANTGSLEVHSTSVTSVAANGNPAVPIVVERPMYFNVYGVASGTDVTGVNTTRTSFYFAASDSRQTTSAKVHETIAILNPGNSSANVTVNYYSGGSLVKSDRTVVPAQQRGTITPSFQGQAAMQVVSDQPIVVERTEYFSGNVTNAGGQTTGAATTVGINSQGNDWLFAEGYTGTDFQENLVLSNFASSGTATATIKLEYTNGTVQTISNVAVAAQSELIFDVNNANRHPNCGSNGNPACTVSNSVSIEVTSSAPIVAERIQYFHFSLNGSMHPGMDDVVGQAGPASQAIYSFAEGQTGTNFNDWLTLQNPNGSAVMATITIFADNTIVQKEISLPAHSRTSILLNDIVNPLVAAYPSSAGNTVSVDVQSFGGPVVAERPLYFVFSGTTGASDIIGYTGN
ncbi:MAG TPA: S53 family peptidase, partial [Ktedonobacteraceae bacterium]|nr:S53 family peptidase [Ktedonobacteraceae bacterium]